MKHTDEELRKLNNLTVSVRGTEYTWEDRRGGKWGMIFGLYLGETPIGTWNIEHNAGFAKTGESVTKVTLMPTAGSLKERAQLVAEKIVNLYKQMT